MEWSWLGVAIVVALAAAVQSVSGFGSALLAVPLLSFVVGSRSAVVLSASIFPLLTLSLVVGHRRHVLRRMLVAMTIPSLAGMPIGLWILDRAGSRLLEIVIGVAVIALAVFLASGFRFPDRASTDVIAGFMSGVLATSTSTNGPPLVLAMQSADASPDQVRGTLSAAFLVQAVLALVGFAITGHLDSHIGRLWLVALPGLAVGGLVGSTLRPSIDAQHFRLLVFGLLFGTAASLLVRAIAG